MKNDNAGSAATSDRTSSSEPPPNAPPSQLSESEFLSQQVSAAGAAIARTLKEMGAELGQTANPIAWAKQYPWVAVGAGAVAGFVTAALIVPSKEEQALKKLAAIERALNPKSSRRKSSDSNGHGKDKAGDDDDHKDDAEPKGSTSVLGMITRELIKTIRPALVSMLTAGISAATVRPSQEEMQAAAAKEEAAEGKGDAAPA